MSNDGKPQIIIRNLRGKKRVGVRGFEAYQRADEIRELVNRYGDALIELEEIEEQSSGLERRWRIGKVIESHIESDEEDVARLTELAEYCTFDIEDVYTLRRYNNFYRMFPNGEYDPAFSKSKYQEFTTNKRIDKGAREAYDRLKEHDINPTVWEIRAWGSVEDFDDLSEIVQQVYDQGATQTTGMEDDIEKVLRGVKRVSIMGGNDPSAITEESIREHLKDIRAKTQ